MIWDACIYHDCFDWFFLLKDIYDERLIHAWDNFEGFSLFRIISSKKRLCLILECILIPSITQVVVSISLIVFDNIFFITVSS